jgi:hypothetical protein
MKTNRQVVADKEWFNKTLLKVDRRNLSFIHIGRRGWLARSLVMRAAYKDAMFG